MASVVAINILLLSRRRTVESTGEAIPFGSMVAFAAVAVQWMGVLHAILAGLMLIASVFMKGPGMLSHVCRVMFATLCFKDL